MLNMKYRVGIQVQYSRPTKNRFTRRNLWNSECCSKIKTDLQVETRGASKDAENNEICNPKYHTDKYKWHTNKRPLQVDVAGASNDAPLTEKLCRHSTHVYKTFRDGQPPPTRGHESLNVVADPIVEEPLMVVAGFLEYHVWVPMREP